MAVVEPRDELARQAIETERRLLAGSVQVLREELHAVSELRGRVRAVLPVALAASLVAAVALDAAVRLLLRRRRA